MAEDSEESNDSQVSHRIAPRNALPPTGSAKINTSQLKLLLAKSSLEMNNCVENGEIPVFGYPTVCFSPIGDG